MHLLFLIIVKLYVRNFSDVHLFTYILKNVLAYDMNVRLFLTLAVISMKKEKVLIVTWVKVERRREKPTTSETRLHLYQAHFLNNETGEVTF